MNARQRKRILRMTVSVYTPKAGDYGTDWTCVGNAVPWWTARTLVAEHEKAGDIVAVFEANDAGKLVYQNRKIPGQLYELPA